MSSGRIVGAIAQNQHVPIAVAISVGIGIGLAVPSVLATKPSTATSRGRSGQGKAADPNLPQLSVWDQCRVRLASALFCVFGDASPLSSLTSGDGARGAGAEEAAAEQRAASGIGTGGASEKPGANFVSAAKHVAIIMDGNRRYGKARYRDGLKGHWDGGQTLVDCVKW